MSATGRATKRHPYDAYSTPKWCTEAIAKQIVWGKDATILEPCAGEGAIADVLCRYPHQSVGCMDINPDCRMGNGVDFLTYEDDEIVDFIITNPPFALAQEFVEKALTLANCTIMLLRLNFLASKTRKEFWEKHPPTAIHVLTKRPSFTGKGTDATDYAWFVWDSTGRQKVGVHWL
jgi:hypothetical protein